MAGTFIFFPKKFVSLLCFVNAEPIIVILRLFKAAKYSSSRALLETSCFSEAMYSTTVNEPRGGGAIGSAVSSLSSSDSLMTKPFTSQTKPSSKHDSATSTSGIGNAGISHSLLPNCLPNCHFPTVRIRVQTCVSRDVTLRSNLG